jgi:hypothetical protein
LGGQCGAALGIDRGAGGHARIVGVGHEFFYLPNFESVVWSTPARFPLGFNKLFGIQCTSEMTDPCHSIKWQSALVITQVKL